MARGDFYDSLFGRVFSAYMEHERAGRVIGPMLFFDARRDQLS